MAQDVLVWSDECATRMAEETPCTLKEDGYLNADTDLKQIVYHPTLNVILLCTNSGIVRVLDVNSGLILQSTSLSAKNCSNIFCQYIPGQDRVVFCDGQSLGIRSDYNGVLLLDTILQKTASGIHQNAKFELLLSEAIILKQCLGYLRGTSSGVDCVFDELTCKIQEAQAQSKKGIKAQKWNTVCLDVPLEYIGFVTSNLLTDLMPKNQHHSDISVVSAMQERVSELMGETAQASNRRAMASEAKRRETFAHWPHMDYLWALPDQMAQAGFYHQPTSAGDDRAMCFTCTVCLVSWERSDEPWNEHERHSPTCPFVMGEYTQNVPLSVTYATNPAIDCTYRGVQVSSIGTSAVSHLLATANPDGVISVYDVSGKIKRTHVFYVKTYDSHLLEKYTQDFGLPGMRKDGLDDNSIERKITAVTIVGDKDTKLKSQPTIRPTIICGISIKCGNTADAETTLNEHNVNIMEVDDSQDFNTKISALYLVLYDFQYTKEVELESPRENKVSPTVPTNNHQIAASDDSNLSMANATDLSDISKKLIIPEISHAALFQFEQNFDNYLLKQELSHLYHSIIPGESDEIYIPKSLPSAANNPNPKQHSGPRMIAMDASNTETDAAQTTSIIIPFDYSGFNGQSTEPVAAATAEKSISDHIVDLQNSGAGKKLNYSRAVQCISLPLAYKYRPDLYVSSILPTQDGRSVLVVLKSICDINSSVLLLYALDLSGKMVKIEEEPTVVRELSCNETPIEINVINFLDKNVEHSVVANVEGLAIMVCIDGAVRIIELSSLTTVSQAKLDTQKFVSAVYCNSLERLCASTEQGTLHFFALADTDADSVEEHEEDDFFNLNTDVPGASSQNASDGHESVEAAHCFHEPLEQIAHAELRRLRQLCEFEVFKGGYNPVVPPCWTEMHQTQRQRRHPQHLQCEKEQITKSFRLQTDTTTWDEHIFEITLPTPINIGHVDVSFTLHSSTPKVEFTLLRQNTTSIGQRREVTFAVDDSVTFDHLQKMSNPVTSKEYLRSHNAEILAGPIAIETCIDLSELSGCVSLTSPKLFKLRNRNLLLHMKSVGGKVAPSASAQSASSSAGGNGSGEYIGCDALYAVSITVYGSTHTDIPHERTLRCSMLESNVFVSNLLLTATQYRTKEEQMLALDILNWVATMRMARNRNQNGEAPGHQIEFLTVVGNYLTGLLNSCIIHGSRTLAHKCVKLLVVCSEGSSLLCDDLEDLDNAPTAVYYFDEAVLTAILEILDNIYNIQSSGSLNWLMTLLSKVNKNTELVKQIATKIIRLLTTISEQIIARNNPFHLILRSRYGLYGTPLEPEMFDVDFPHGISQHKASSTTMTYASIVAGENITSHSADFYSNLFNKYPDHLDPKDVLLNLGENKTKLKNIAPAMIFRGLLETEALHFTCFSASEGARIERADAGAAGVIHTNFAPISVTQAGNSGTKKVEIEQLFQDFNLMYPEINMAKQHELPVAMDNAFENYANGHTVLLYEGDNAKVYGPPCLAPPMSLPPASIQHSQQLNQHQESIAAKLLAEETLLPHKSLAWQQLLVTPPAQVIVVERMHSGARRFVTLDFGQPIILTDIFLPSCAELLSISVDIWLRGEDIDMQRLLHATDIGTKNLVLSDLQPPPLCRYLKITVVGRYGMSPTRCRIPIGSYYGHLIVLPDEVPLEYASSFTAPKSCELEKHLSVLSMLFEDVSCRYSLSCSKLKRLLEPFLLSDTSNIAHLNAYMEIMKDKQNTNPENLKVFNAYQEAMTYQRQLNAVRMVMCRIEGALKNIAISSQEDPAVSLESAAIDKLRSIAEVLFEMLLIMDVIPKISLDTCEKLFKGYCISQQSHLQFLAATVLDHSCRKRAFWGVFLSRTLAEMFSSSFTSVFPQDRVFVLLAYLVKRCSERSVALDATLKVIAETLYPLTEKRSCTSLVGVTIDLPLLNWLLLFLSMQLDLSKSGMQNPTRWDWVTGEFAGKTSETVNSTYKRKLHKKFLLYKQQLDTLDHKQIAQELAEKMEEAYKGTSIMLDKMKDIKKSIKISLVPPYLQQQISGTSSKSTSTAATSTGTQGKKRRDVASETSGEKTLPIQDPQYIDGMHCLAVVKAILKLLLEVDHSCSADMFILACKVIARLIKLSNLSMDEYLDDEKLLKLINLGINSDLPFVTHALACLLQDSLDIGKTPTNKEPDVLAPSTSWSSDILRDVESLCDFEIEDAFISEPVVKQGKTSMNSNHLPSVFESDDSEIEDFLDEVIERGRSLLKKGGPKGGGAASGGASISSSVTSSVVGSCAMDQRLNVSVDLQVEMTLRRLVHYNTYALLQSLNSRSVHTVEVDYTLSKWPDCLITTVVQSDAEPKKQAVKDTHMLTNCFDMLFTNLELQSYAKIEQTLQLWLTLNCQGDEKFNPTTMPSIQLSNDAIASLIKTVACCADLTLRTWCSALQILTLMCNVPQGNLYDTNETDICRLFGKTSVIINHPDFVKLFLRLLSGTGVQYCDKGLAGPGLCKAMHDLMIRLQMRCDVTNPTSIPGIRFKSHMLKVVYHMVQPGGPLASKLGPLDAQCKLLHSLACLDYNNVDLNIAMSILESTGTLTLSHVLNAERIKCVNIGERLNAASVSSFNFIFASVLGGENNKQDKPVSWDLLLIYLLKLLSSLIKTPLDDGQNNHQPTFMETDPQPTSQTDESKAEQIHQDIPTVRSTVSANSPCLADTVLQHHPTVIRFCRALASCKTTTLSMIPHTQINAQNPLSAFTDAATVGDAVFNVLSALAHNATQKQFIMAPLCLYLSQNPQLSEPLIWFIIQVLDTPESLKIFLTEGGIDIICKSLITSSNAPNTLSLMGSIASVMQHFIGHTSRTDASAIGVPSNTKKQQQASLENNLNLFNFAPQGTIKCSTSSTAHSPEILIQGGQAAHRRARAPQWSYHFYPEEAHADLTITLPSAILLREVHIQPHQGTLATCPSAVSLEVSANGPSRLVPACPPIPTSGMSFIRLHLPAPEVVNCVQIRLYKPREASNIGLSQIRLLGTSAFGGNSKPPIMDLSEDESHCRFSLGWLRLFYHCCTIAENSDAENEIIAKAAAMPDLLSTCCGLLLVPTHIPSLYLGNLGKILCELCLYSRENAAHTIKMLLGSKSLSTESSICYNSNGGKLLLNSPGAQSACEVLYKLCSHQDNDTAYRLHLVLSWLCVTACNSIENYNCITCSPAYISIIASIIWDAKENNAPFLDEMITVNLFEIVYAFNSVVKDKIAALKFALDALLCSLCYVKSEFFPLLLQKMSVLIPNQSTDIRAPISDDRKESDRMTDDSKHNFDYNYEWYERLIISDINDLLLSSEVLDTIALVGRSPIVIQQLLDSRLPHMLNTIIHDYCNNCNPDAPMCNLENVTAILKFFADICEEKVMRDWLGSPEGSHFWLSLLQYLCKNGSGRKSNLRPAEHSYLEEVCVRFLSKCCLCHTNNQTLLARVLCDVIAQQTSGISGFLRRLILQLLLESEKILVSVKADETLYMNSNVLHPHMPMHPAFKQTYGRALLYLGTNTTISDILEQYVSFSMIKTNPSNIKVDSINEVPKLWNFLSSDSDLSVAAGVTAKDKRVKDAKNAWATSTPIKKKRYITDETKVNDVVDGRVVKCSALAENRLPLDLTLAQVLKMIEDKGTATDLTCLHLIICQNKGDNEEDANKHKLLCHTPLSNTLQVFSSMGGLALLAQHLPTVYPETLRQPPSDRPSSENSESDWIKVDGSDDIYEDIDEGPVSNTPTKIANSTQNVPAHSLTAFGLFLRLPGYAEVLLKDMKKAHGLLRLVLGVTDDGEGGDIFESPIADSLPTLPFEVLKRLYDASPLSTDDGTVLRRLSISNGVVHLLLACLGIFTHQTQGTKGDKDQKNRDDKGQLYWAKGTGFGTGSTQQSWNVEQALLKQRSEEEHVTVLLQVLSSYINPKGNSTVELSQDVLPVLFEDLLIESALLPALCSYLRNDSVLDMARHIPLYRAVLELLRAMAVSSQLVKMLLPQRGSKDPSISKLLKNMKTCVDTYASKLRSAQTLKVNKKSNSTKSTSMKIKYKSGEQLEEMERDEGLAMLMPDIQLTATLVCVATDKLIEADEKLSKEMILDRPMSISPEEQYLKIMKKLQFDTFEMLEELPEGGYKFTISHHYEANVRSASDSSHPARVKRLAQEAVTLATSLPLSHSSSVFVRCDTDRLDIMKVLITGPSDTPYANGCFEFDIYFPPEYPLAPMLINLETTGHHSVRFNPNLYNDGKVCLSVLNTWHGRPEEKWNAQTSSFLQVLVSIQSLILVSEPYFNEPGYERSRGTPAGTQSSREYNTNICQATTRWAMLEQLVNPCPCFKDVIFSHFYIKRQEIMEQVERWIKDLENDSIEKRTNRTNNKRNVFTTLDSFKKLYDKLKGILIKLTPPEGLEEETMTCDLSDTVMQVDSVAPPPASSATILEDKASDMTEMDFTSESDIR